MNSEARSMSAELPVPAPARIVAVHEAGHVVAHILTAEEMGVSPKHAVSYVEMFNSPQPAREGPGRCEAVVEVPRFSPDFWKVESKMGGNGPHAGEEFEYLKRVVTEARRHGVNVD